MVLGAGALPEKRFEGQIKVYKKHDPSGGLGCFTPDSFPVFDVFRENVYVDGRFQPRLQDARVSASWWHRRSPGESSELLEPFRFSRYEEGKLHPVSNSPFPWS